LNAPIVVLDCSIVLAHLMPDEESAYASEVLYSLVDRQALVPAVWPLEVANALLVAHRRGRIAKGGFYDALRRIEDLRFLEDHTSCRVVLNDMIRLAEQYGLSSYDASYLELAIRARLPVATLDEKLSKSVVQAGLSIYRP
jgi:predicted nucleic acid-binding protein